MAAPRLRRPGRARAPTRRAATPHRPRPPPRPDTSAASARAGRPCRCGSGCRPRPCARSPAAALDLVLAGEPHAARSGAPRRRRRRRARDSPSGPSPPRSAGAGQRRPPARPARSARRNQGRCRSRRTRRFGRWLRPPPRVPRARPPTAPDAPAGGRTRTRSPPRRSRPRRRRDHARRPGTPGAVTRCCHRDGSPIGARGYRLCQNRMVTTIDELALAERLIAFDTSRPEGIRDAVAFIGGGSKPRHPPSGGRTRRSAVGDRHRRRGRSHDRVVEPRRRRSRRCRTVHPAGGPDGCTGAAATT